MNLELEDEELYGKYTLVIEITFIENNINRINKKIKYAIKGK